MHYVSGDIPTEPFEARVRVRYKAPEETALVTLLGESGACDTRTPTTCHHTGQAAVFYSDEDDDEVLCGGIIEE